MAGLRGPEKKMFHDVPHLRGHPDDRKRNAYTMCARFEINHTAVRRGMRVPVLRGRGAETVRWTGFARAERLDWWKRRGATLVEIPAERFAECSIVSEDLVWQDLQPDEAILGIIVEVGGNRTLRVVTRSATAEELLHFQSFRMPVVRHEEYTDVPLPEMMVQPEMFR